MNRFAVGLLISAIVHVGVIVYGFAPETTDAEFNVQSGRSSVEMVFASAARASSSAEEKQEKKQEKSETKNEEKTKEKQQEKTEKEPNEPQTEKSKKPDETKPEQPVEEVAKSSEAETAADAKQLKTSSSQKKTKKTKENTEEKQSKQSAPQAVKHAGVKWVQDADYRRNPSPRYPTRARVRHQEGAVKLLVKINKQGYPVKISVRDSSGYHLLDRAAKRAVQRWEFVPAEKHGEPVASMTVVPVQFSLDR